MRRLVGRREGLGVGAEVVELVLGAVEGDHGGAPRGKVVWRAQKGVLRRYGRRPPPSFPGRTPSDVLQGQPLAPTLARGRVARRPPRAECLAQPPGQRLGRGVRFGEVADRPVPRHKPLDHHLFLLFVEGQGSREAHVRPRGSAHAHDPLRVEPVRAAVAHDPLDQVARVLDHLPPAPAGRPRAVLGRHHGVPGLESRRQVALKAVVEAAFVPAAAVEGEEGGLARAAGAGRPEDCEPQPRLGAIPARQPTEAAPVLLLLVPCRRLARERFVNHLVAVREVLPDIGERTGGVHQKVARDCSHAQGVVVCAPLCLLSLQPRLAEEAGHLLGQPRRQGEVGERGEEHHEERGPEGPEGQKADARTDPRARARPWGYP
mmetsp:Transcript_35594/g.80277  ORF Transcript_35594/g.80277 Transcript_35594/m.80277 type:complete len:375 (+) Transcript_35594:233-1357(+)